MRQTTFRTKSDSADERIVVPTGIIRLVRTGFIRYGLRDLLDGFKEGGVPLGLVIENFCIACLSGEYSMNEWDSIINRSEVRKKFFCGKYGIRRWTFQRALERLGNYLEEVVVHLTKVSRTMFPDLPTYAYADGSHIKRNGLAGKNVLYGEGGGSVQPQDQFMVAADITTGIPVSAELYPGNLNDPSQYNDFIPQLMYLLKEGSMVVFDNGGSGASVLNSILSHGGHYLTRVKTNASDERYIAENADQMIYVGLDAACLSRTFESSGRTVYLFFSSVSYIATVARAEKAVALKEIQRKKAQKIIEENKPLKLLKWDKNPFYTIEVNGVKLIQAQDPWTELDPEKELKDAIPADGGWFKLECSFPMDPRLALLVYRHRVDIEHLISMLKSVVKLDPVRVWSVDSTRGKLAAGFITAFILSAMLNDLEGKKTLKILDGKPVSAEAKLSAATVVKELNRYQSIVSMTQWGTFDFTDAFDKNPMQPFVTLFDKYDSEGKIGVSEDIVWRTDPPAQWSSAGKNSKHLAPLIAQYFEKEIFPEWMADRCHWKRSQPGIKRVDLEQKCPSNDLGAGTGLKGKTSYYEAGDERV